jgi:RimJ/RimL family protein N-acetyltransferase
LSPLATIARSDEGVAPDEDAPSVGSTVLTLETEHLLLRQFRASDFEPYAAMCADPEVMRYVGERGVLSREDAWRQMAMLAGHWQLRGYGMWAVEERATGGFIGRVGLHFPEGWPDQEVAWAFARAHWGRGFAFEAASAALTYAFDSLHWPRVISLIDPDNSRSIRLAERLGEQFEREVVVRGHRVSLYSLRREGGH